MSRATEFTSTTVIVIVLVAATTMALLLFFSGGFTSAGYKFKLLSDDLGEVAGDVDVGADEWGICLEGWYFSESPAKEASGGPYQTKRECLDAHRADFSGYRCQRSGVCECRCLG